MAKTSEAERVAMKIGKLVNDLTLDLDQVGIYLARDTMITHRRLVEIIEAANYEREQTELRSNDYDTLF